MSQPIRHACARALLAVTCAAWAPHAQAGPADAKKEPSVRSEPRKEEPAGRQKATPAATPDLQQYCSNVAATAGAARIVRQEKQLQEIEQQVAKRVAELDAKRVDLQALIDKYDALVRKADETIVGVYTRMKPDAAAAQIANLDEEQAAALMLQLKPKSASAILGEMDAARAALVAKKMSSLSSIGRAGKTQ
jgi:flagellar motility protein MotE (MotC chaperone)